MFTNHTQFAAGDHVSPADVRARQAAFDRLAELVRGCNKPWGTISCVARDEHRRAQDMHNRLVARQLAILVNARTVRAIPPSRWQRFKWWIEQPIDRLRRAWTALRGRDDWYDL